jgi:hypothetical protein
MSVVLSLEETNCGGLLSFQIRSEEGGVKGLAGVSAVGLASGQRPRPSVAVGQLVGPSHVTPGMLSCLSAS